MDGVNSASMRNKGLLYNLNFGVPVVTLKKIAGKYVPDAGLAENLWRENVRELKILATLIQPSSTFVHTNEWAESIDNLELAEQASANLFSKVPDAGENARGLLQSTELYPCICGFLIYARLFMNNYSLPLDAEDEYFLLVIKALCSDSLLLKNVTVSSLKKLGRQSFSASEKIMEKLRAEEIELNSQIQTAYEEIRSEFHFYYS